VTNSLKRHQLADARYMADRARLAEKYSQVDLWSVVDHWPLFAGIYSISRFLAISKLVERSLVVPGHLAEVGSWRGANLLFMAKLQRILDPHSNKQVHAFDGFEGLQDFAPADGDATAARGMYKGSIDELTDIIDLYALNDDIVIHKGMVENTLPELLAARPELSFSLVYIDVDLYSPTLVALNQFHERLASGGMFVLDEWNIAKFPGESVAVREFLTTYPTHYKMEHVENTRQPSLVLTKIRS
jgi:hypothetical protein